MRDLLKVFSRLWCRRVYKFRTLKVLVQGASVIAVDLQSEQMIDVLSAASDDECQALSFVEVDACEEFSENFFDSNADLDGMVNAIYPRGKGYGAELD